jgi:hypothetical protein
MLTLSLCRRTVAAEPGAQDAPKDVATVVALAPSFLASVVVVVLAATDGGCSHSELELVCVLSSVENRAISIKKLC